MWALLMLAGLLNLAAGFAYLGQFVAVLYMAAALALFASARMAARR